MGYLSVPVIGAVVLLALSLNPGALIDFLTLSIFLLPCGLFLLLPLLVMGWLGAALSARGRERARESTRYPARQDWKTVKMRWVVVSALAPVLAILLIASGLPRRAAFIVSRPSFMPFIEEAPLSQGPFQPPTPRHRIGLFTCDGHYRDPRGGVYFRTHSGPDGIGPDTMSYGFAYKPNDVGSPFGRAWYQVDRISGDWYVFSASDDN